MNNRKLGLRPRTTATLNSLLTTAAALGVMAAVTGCGMNGTGAGKTGTGLGGNSVTFSGSVHGGQQPVAGATIQLYAMGTTGLKSASTPLIASTVLTDAGGNFTITGTYTCPSNTSQVYLAATGGNPGGGVNSAIALTAALGNCSNLQANAATTFINLNELTTVAAAYGLQPFAADLTHVGATGSGPLGLANAIQNSSLLVSYVSGTSPGTLGTGVTVPVAELNTLGNIIAACVNSAGPGSGSCSTLFSATGTTNTFTAALAIARNPGAAAITSLYTQSTAAAPFQPSLSAQPKDFTVAITSTAAGSLATPYGIAIDAAGNAFVTNESGASVTRLDNTTTNTGTLTGAGIFGAQGVALDRSGNLWVANTAGNNVVRFAATTGTGNGFATPTSYTGNAVKAPSAIAIDSAGNVAVSNFNGNSVSILTNGGAALAGSPFTGNNGITVPTGIAYGPAGNLYVTSGNGSVVKLANTGAYVANYNDGSLQGTAAVAVDAQQHIVATGFTSSTTVNGALSQFNSIGTPVSGSPVTAGLNFPAGVASDGTNIFVANSVSGGSLAQYQYGSVTPMSPTAGYGTVDTPVGVAVDASGCVWTTNSGSNTVSKFIGLSVPVATPLAANVGP